MITSKLTIARALAALYQPVLYYSGTDIVGETIILKGVQYVPPKEEDDEQDPDPIEFRIIIDYEPLDINSLIGHLLGVTLKLAEMALGKDTIDRIQVAAWIDHTDKLASIEYKTLLAMANHANMEDLS